MQDGYTQSGAGDSDMRVAGKDLQHNIQDRTAVELHVPVRVVRRASDAGGPMKEALDRELARHDESRGMRLKDLERHYQR